MSRNIEDYALIGDGRTAALVSRDASIDWLCLPRFDSGSCFASLLGDEAHGHWSLRPVGPIRATTRRYRPGTLVLETTFATDEGRATVIDCMPMRRGAPHVVRVVVGEEGCVRFRAELVLRFDFGSVVPWVRRLSDGHGIRAIAGPDCVIFRSPMPVHGEKLTTVGEIDVRAGDRAPFVLTWYRSYDECPPRVDAEVAIEETARFWCGWSARCTFAGPARPLVLRSLTTLKALIDSSTGGMVAAPTTSLPEKIGGTRNWDYRFCWLRDATFTLYALLQSGYVDEARGWREWLLRAAAGDPSRLQIMYATSGARRLTELELPWLPGYAGSRPVRIGNAAHGQLQLDVYGEIMDAMHQCYRAKLAPEEEAWALQRALLGHLERAWTQPDHGIWEVRGPRRHFTHSKVMAWLALDRGIKSAQLIGAPAPIERWCALRATIHAEVCERGFDSGLQSFVQSYGSQRLDASLLMMPLCGFLPAHDPRVLGTVRAIQRNLVHGGLVFRYSPDPHVDGLPGNEGAFLPCSFWLCDNLVLSGRHAEAQALFERLTSVANDVGLLAEEYDPTLGRLVGNFPQAFSHVALINSAHNLWQQQGPASHRGGT